MRLRNAAPTEPGPCAVRSNAPCVVAMSHGAEGPTTIGSPAVLTVTLVISSAWWYVDHTRVPPPVAGKRKRATMPACTSGNSSEIGGFVGRTTPGVVGKLFDHVRPANVTSSGFVGSN